MVRMEKKLMSVCSAAKCCKMLCFTVAICLFVGCGDGGPPTGDLLGKVYHQDELVGDCTISIYSPSTKRTLGAKVGPEGEFKLTKIPLGEYDVCVRQKTSNASKEEGENSSDLIID